MKKFTLMDLLTKLIEHDGAGDMHQWPTDIIVMGLSTKYIKVFAFPVEKRNPETGLCYNIKLTKRGRKAYENTKRAQG